MAVKKEKTKLILTRTESEFNPTGLVEEFIMHCGFDPSDCARNHEGLPNSWVIPLPEELQLEIILDNPQNILESSLYLGVNITSVPIKRTQDFLVNALELADSLHGAKVSIVGHFLVLSNNLLLVKAAVPDLNHQLSELIQQLKWYRSNLISELAN